MGFIGWIAKQTRSMCRQGRAKKAKVQRNKNDTKEL